MKGSHVPLFAGLRACLVLISECREDYILHRVSQLFDKTHTLPAQFSHLLPSTQQHEKGASSKLPSQYLYDKMIQVGIGDVDKGTETISEWDEASR